MVTEYEKAFLKEIITNPEQDAPRLLYADYIEECGQSIRAEFIRTQIALANIPPKPEACVVDNSEVSLVPILHFLVCARCLWEKQYEELLEKLKSRELELYGSGEDYKPDLSYYSEISRCQFGRGFLEELACSWDWWKTVGSNAIQESPLKKVTLVGKHPFHFESGQVNTGWRWGTFSYQRAPVPEEPQYIARELFIQLPIDGFIGEDQVGNLLWESPSEGMALKCLSDACLRYAKSRSKVLES